MSDHSNDAVVACVYSGAMLLPEFFIKSFKFLLCILLAEGLGNFEGVDFLALSFLNVLSLEIFKCLFFISDSSLLIGC